ncbi:MAG: extracellular solute-binding protein [Anaerolineaceae bacterium]|nr:extracellular solute-binding protein [Anaerolineaceae bacterium]
MRTKVVKLFTIFILMVLVISILPACAPTEELVAEEPEVEEAEEAEVEEAAPAIEPGELEVGVLWEEGSASFDLVKSIGDSLEADFPGTKVIYTFNNTAARPQIETRMMAGDPLDIDFIFEGMDPNSFSWVENGYIMDISEYLNEDRGDGTAWKDDFNPLFYPSMQYDGKFYGVPEQVFIWALHYNKGMFDEWGLEPPTTWAELLEVSDQIIEKSGGEVDPIAVTGQVNYYVGMWFDSLAQRLCGTEKVMEFLYGDTGTMVSDDACFLEAAQEANKLKENDYLIEGWEGTDFTTVQVFFFQEKAAMILMGSWLMTEMKDSIPEGFELGVVPFVSVDGGAGDQTAVFGRALSWNIPADTDVPDLAAEFLKRFTSDEIALKRVNDLGAISPNANVGAPTAIAGADELLANAATAEFILYNYGVGSAKFGLASAWYDPLVEMWLGDLTPEEALAKIDANVEAVREQRASE